MTPILLLIEAPPQQPSERVACPVCGGAMRELRGVGQCQRCQYICCQSCDGERANADFE